MANQPVSKICIPMSLADTFLPCVDEKSKPVVIFAAEEVEDDTCTEGKVPLLSPRGAQQLQTLMLMLAIIHVASSLFTLVLGEIKMKKWESWEKETHTLDHKLSMDNRRFQLTKETTFGRRHLKYWSNNIVLLWIVCLMRQFMGSVSKADYFALRNGFINAHLGPNIIYNFKKFLRRSLDKDFTALVTISLPIWTYVILFILFNAHGFYAYYWLPFLPLAVLMVIGAKLETIITEMCLRSSKETVIIAGEFSVYPNDKLFWFGQPRWLLYAIQFILIENSFQLGFILWDLYTFGYHSCLHRKTLDFSISLGVSLLVQFLSAYVTLPLYALVGQMGSSMKETVFADQVVLGLKNWQTMAKRSLSSANEAFATPPPPSSRPSTSSARRRSTRKPAPPPKPRALPESSSSRGQMTSSRLQIPGTGVSSSGSPWTAAPASGRVGAEGFWSNPVATSSPEFEFPKLDRRELAEFHRVTEEMMGLPSRGGTGGELSFRMWWTKEVISAGGGRSPRAELRRGNEWAK